MNPTAPPRRRQALALAAACRKPVIARVTERSSARPRLRIGGSPAGCTACGMALEMQFISSRHLFSPAREPLGGKTSGRRSAPPAPR